jgi:Cupin
MVTEAALQRPGQLAVLSRITEVLFVEVLRSWIKSLGPGMSVSRHRAPVAYEGSIAISAFSFM